MIRLLTVVLFLTAAGVEGQDHPAAESATRSPALVNLNFGGGTLSQLVAQLRELDPATNIVIPVQADEVILPPIHVKRAEVYPILMVAAHQASGSSLAVSVQPFGSHPPLYSVRVERRESDPPKKQSSPTRVHVLSLRGLDTPAATILSAMESALESFKSEPGPTLRFHAASQLVFVEGTDAAIDLVIGTLYAIRETNQDGPKLPRGGAAEGRNKTETPVDPAASSTKSR